MRTYLQRISSYFMQIWVEEKVKQRAVEDAFLIGLFRELLSEADTLEKEWNACPRRLQCKILRLLPQWLEEAASEGSTQLIVMLKNAEMCDMYRNKEEEKRLYAKALATAKGIAKIPFAKLLHGEVLPIELVEHIAEQFTEILLWDPLASTLATKDYAAKLLEEIHTEEHRQRYLQFLAAHGQYVLLRQTCALRNIPIPTDMLDLCLHTCLAKGSRPRYIAEQCIALCTIRDDWSLADEVIKTLSPRSEADARYVAQTMLMHTSKNTQTRSL